MKSKLLTISSVNKNALFLMIFTILLLKLILISVNEIYLTPGDNLPYNYMADKGFWNLPFLPYRPPIFILWIEFTHFIGVKFRIAQEILFLFSLGLLSYALNLNNIRKFINIIAIILLAYAPTFTYHLDQVMADGFYSVLNIYIVSLFLILIRAESNRVCIFVSFIFSINVVAIIHSKMELEMALCITLSFFVFLVYRARKNRKYSASALSIIVFVIPIVISYATIFGLNYKYYQYEGSTNLLSSNEKELLHQLMVIDGGTDGPYIPITESARIMAYKASPTLNKWKSAIENPLIIKYSEDYTGVKGSLDTQRYIGLLKNIHPSTKCILSDKISYSKQQNIKISEREAILKEISIELKNAIASGNLPSKNVFTPSMINPDIFYWISGVPSAFGKYINLLFSAPNIILDNQGYGVPIPEKERMDRILFRDSNLTQKGPLSGTLTTNLELESIELFVNSNLLACFKPCKYELIPIKSTILNSIKDNEYYFEFPKMTERWTLLTLGMNLHSSDGKSYVVESLQPNVEMNINEKVNFKITDVEFPIIQSEFQRITFKIQTTISEFYREFIIILSVIISIVSVFYHKRICQALKIDGVLVVTLLFLTFLFLARMVVMIIIESSAWHIDMRYTLPAFPYYIVLMVFLVNTLIKKR